MKQILYITVILLLLGCSSLKESMIRTGENVKELAINNAIIDFSSKCNLFKKDSVFHVSFNEKVVYLVPDYETREFVVDTIYEDLILVGISGEINKIPYLSTATIGSKGKLPSRYMEVDGKLFYWQDDDYPLTEETLYVFIKNNLLTEVIDVNNLMIPDFIIDDSQKGADYYFCKNDLSKYKRVVTNIGSGYYKPPKVKCSK